jgi:purine-nucleoside phosphorylase
MARVGNEPAIAYVSGSGIDLRPMLDTVTKEISFPDIAGLPATSVPGHSGVFILGKASGKPIILQCGRLHIYEGHSIEVIQRTVDALIELGADRVVFTNAAGGLLPSMKPGDLMAVREFLPWPYVGWPDAPQRIPLPERTTRCDHEGAYVWVHGPNYETPAEIRTMQDAGGSAVGMSAAMEAARCIERDVPCAAVSCITNAIAHQEKLTHDHVLAMARRASARLVEVLSRPLLPF